MSAAWKVRKVWCPWCNAQPDEPCRQRNGQRRDANHRDRVERYTRGLTQRQAPAADTGSGR